MWEYKRRDIRSRAEIFAMRYKLLKYLCRTEDWYKEK